MTETTYNGWTNYETWLVNLWMDNEQGSHEFWRSIASEHYENAEPTKYLTRTEAACFELADYMKLHFENWSPLDSEASSVYHDLLGAALSSVNWDEIARHWIDAAIEDLEAA